MARVLRHAEGRTPRVAREGPRVRDPRVARGIGCPGRDDGARHRDGRRRRRRDRRGESRR